MVIEKLLPWPQKVVHVPDRFACLPRFQIKLAMLKVFVVVEVPRKWEEKRPSRGRRASTRLPKLPRVITMEMANKVVEKRSSNINMGGGVMKPSLGAAFRLFKQRLTNASSGRISSTSSGAVWGNLNCEADH